MQDHLYKQMYRLEGHKYDTLMLYQNQYSGQIQHGQNRHKSQTISQKKSMAFSQEMQLQPHDPSESWDTNGNIIIYDLNKGNIVKKFKLLNQFTSIDISYDGKTIISGGQDKMIEHFSIPHMIVKDRAFLPGWIQKVIMSEKMSYIACTIYDISSLNKEAFLIFIFKFNQLNEEEPLQLQGHQSKIIDIKFNPANEQIIASFEKKNRLCLWDIKQKKIIGSENVENIQCIEFNGQGNILSCGNIIGDIVLYQINNGALQSITTIYAHKQSIINMSFCQQDNILASIGYDKSIKIWNIQGSEYENMESIDFSHDSKPVIVTLDAQGNKLVSIDEKHQIKVWKLDYQQH